MSLKPDMTIRELVADESARRELVEIILSNGVRGAMSSRGVSYDGADRIALGVKHGVDGGLERWLERQEPAESSQPGPLPEGCSL